MAEVKKNSFILKNILGDTKSTIEAIQKYLKNNSKPIVNNETEDETPAASVNKILKSVECEETSAIIQNIINKL